MNFGFCLQTGKYKKKKFKIMMMAGWLLTLVFVIVVVGGMDETSEVWYNLVGFGVVKVQMA